VSGLGCNQNLVRQVPADCPQLPLERAKLASW